MMVMKSLESKIRGDVKGVTAERSKLYSQVPPPGDTIPVTIDPFEVEDGVPTEAEVEWTVKRLRNNRAGGPSSTSKGSMVTVMVSPGGVPGCTVLPSLPLPA